MTDQPHQPAPPTFTPHAPASVPPQEPSPRPPSDEPPLAFMEYAARLKLLPIAPRYDASHTAPTMAAALAPAPVLVDALRKIAAEATANVRHVHVATAVEHCSGRRGLVLAFAVGNAQATSVDVSFDELGEAYDKRGALLDLLRERVFDALDDACRAAGVPLSWEARGREMVRRVMTGPDAPSTPGCYATCRFDESRALLIFNVSASRSATGWLTLECLTRLANNRPAWQTLMRSAILGALADATNAPTPVGWAYYRGDLRPLFEVPRVAAEIYGARIVADCYARDLADAPDLVAWIHDTADAIRYEHNIDHPYLLLSPADVARLVREVEAYYRGDLRHATPAEIDAAIERDREAETARAFDMRPADLRADEPPPIADRGRIADAIDRACRTADVEVVTVHLQGVQLTVGCTADGPLAAELEAAAARVPGCTVGDVRGAIAGVRRG